ncbi:hypothetical protein [Marivita sp.]|jgi:Asp-tRNA(Asn)/Glu-tRNA(Gln) amidotransferase A subunit family amidase|uniref:hypothetical protein n=1 Tax=Marivita sp. TaxID=2003365 RepID=UPI003F6B6219
MMLHTPARTDPNDLCLISATTALVLFQERKLSPVDLLEAQIARAEQVEPDINALPRRCLTPL